MSELKTLERNRKEDKLLQGTKTKVCLDKTQKDVKNIVYADNTSSLVELVASLLTQLRLWYYTHTPARSFALLSHRLPSSQPLAYIIARLHLACFTSSYSVMYIYSSLSLSILPPNSLVVFVTLTKVKAVLA